ncbi:MAG: hypothetical protein QXX17_04545 [Conexivisphaerales archaeon]
MGSSDDLLEDISRELSEILHEAQECESVMLEYLRDLCLNLSDEDIDEAIDFFLGPRQADDMDDVAEMVRDEISRASAKDLVLFLRNHIWLV